MKWHLYNIPSEFSKTVVAIDHDFFRENPFILLVVRFREIKYKYFED